MWQLLGSSAVALYYKAECSKASSRFSKATFKFETVPLAKGSIAQTLLNYMESMLADLVIVGSVALGKGDGSLGSVSAAIAKKTAANVLIAKNFAQ